MTEHIPNELKSLRRWVCAWATSKVPMQAMTRRGASSTDPATWGTWEEAESAVKSGLYDYVGFVFAGDGIVGIDIDAGFDEGLMTPLCADIVGLCRSYTERSRSGRGVHILLRGTLPFPGRNNFRGVEIYQSRRYFILTGRTLLYRELISNQPAIDAVVERYFPDTPVSRSGVPSAGNRIYSPVYHPPEGSRIRLTPDYPEIPEGGRNLSLTSLAGQMHTAGYDRERIYTELKRVNESRCRPPLPEGELRSIVRSVSRYER